MLVAALGATIPSPHIAPERADEVLALCLTESTGNRPRDLRCTATPQPDGRWLLQGEKSWSTFGTAATTLLVIVCFAALGAGNGAVFQLVPLRWPLSTAVAGSMIGEFGALGGGLVPNLMGLSKQHAGTYAWGFVLFAVLAALMLVVMRYMQIRWTRTWAEKGGRARATPSAPALYSSGLS